jgi:hypothetical protein
MNRVDPLREGSGECYALSKLDVGARGKFRNSAEKISLQIISLINKLYRLYHNLYWACARACYAKNAKRCGYLRVTEAAAGRASEGAPPQWRSCGAAFAVPKKGATGYRLCPPGGTQRGQS